MEHALMPPDISSAVFLDAINGEAVDEMSMGQLALAKAFFGEKLSERLADPDSAAELATFQKAAGEDWSGHGSSFSPNDEGPIAKPAPIPPENNEDTIQCMLLMLLQHERSTESDLANFVRKLDFGLKDQSAYFGVPEGIEGFTDAKDVLRQTAKMSTFKANKIMDRATYFTYGSDSDRTRAGASPKLPKMAAAFAEGRVPAENLDRTISIDHDVTKYAREVGKTPEYAGEVLQAIEPLLLEAAESATPEEFSREKHRWLEKIAHHIDVDGPPPSEVLRKKPDNALRIRSHEDGTTTASMHMEPAWGAFLKEFLNTNLNFKGDTPLLPDNIDNLYKAAADAKAATETPNDTGDEAPNGGPQPAEQPAQEHPTEPDEIVAEDAAGNTYTAKEINTLDRLSRAERAGAILLGALYSVMSMSPREAPAKTAHGSPAKLVIVQDIQTAYQTLGLPALPEAVRRPDGPEGMLPTVIKRPNPDNPNAPNFIEHTNSDNVFTGHVNPVPWTPYQSEVVNVGPMHPKNAEPALCDAELVGQVWNGPDIVLHEYRSKRMFTKAQRKALFARDKGCMAPGCTIPATYCQCHHCKEWCNDGLTNEHNGLTICSRHHSDVHNGKWRIRKIDGLTFFQPAPWVDPYQPLLRNLYWK